MKDEKIKPEFKARLYCYIIRLVKFLTKLPNVPVIREIKSQLTRSGSSIGANYFEAKGASSKRDYLNYYTIALKSANESLFWLGLLRDSKLVPKELDEECQYLIKETKEIANIFASSILTMKGKRK
jgi:four helix bundle protein